MGSDKHIGNYQSIIMKNYKTIVGLINMNKLADRLEINYDQLDSKTAGTLKDAINLKLHNFLKEKLPKEKEEYIKKLKKQNTTYKLDIDYLKIDDQELNLAYKLKMCIQNTLEERKKIVYRDMTLNTNY